MGSFNNIKKKTFKNISLTYINMNKMIFFTNYIYKITKQTKNYYYLNGLQTDNKLIFKANEFELYNIVKLCLLYTSPSPRDGLLSRMPSSA